MNDYERMNETRIDKRVFGDIMNRLFNVELEDTQDNVSTRTKKNIQKFNTTLENELNSHGETMWGLFNAVTYFENHIRVKEDKKEESIFMGSAYRHMNMTFETIMEYINKHTAKSVLITQ